MKFAAALLALLITSSSVPAAESTTGADARIIRALFEHYSAAVAARNVDGIMALYATDVVVFDAFPPRRYIGVAAYRKDYEDFFAAYPGPVSS
jgi:ketosteroid isomerase-like protein